MGFLWVVLLEQRSNSRANGPELIIILRKFVKRKKKKKKLDKTSHIYNKERGKLQLVGRDFPQEYSDMKSVYPDRLIA